MKIKLSICIPTYNRSKHLVNCLESIYLNDKDKINYQICISNNCSNDNTEAVVKSYMEKLPIKYSKNDSNLGVARNVLRVVEMADGEFVWLIGDDDLLMPNALEEINTLIQKNFDVDYFYINSFHLTTEYILSYPSPFNTAMLPKNMEPFTKFNKEGKYKFLELINPEISFDFLGGMFLALFRRELWLNKVDILDRNSINDPNVFSTFENTFVHVKIFANAFSESQAYFYPTPLSVCLTGAREWSPKYSLVRSVRLIEALEEYRKNGLSFLKYIYCRNVALSYFFQDMVYMYLDKEERGWFYINPVKEVLKNIFYPNMYLSVIYAVFRKIRNKIMLRKKND